MSFFSSSATRGKKVLFAGAPGLNRCKFSSTSLSGVPNDFHCRGTVFVLGGGFLFAGGHDQ